MAYNAPSDPVAGTVITVAAYVVNSLDNIRWLRVLMGGADPTGTGYVVTSDSTSTTSWKTGVAAILHVLGYTPANKAGDSFGGAISATSISSAGVIASSNATGNAIAATVGGVSATTTVTAGTTVQGLDVSATNTLSGGSLDIAGAADIDGTLDAGALVVGNNATVGGTLGVSGQVTGASFQTAGTINTDSVSGNSIQTDGGISAAGNIAATGGLVGASLTIAGVTSSATPGAGRIPMGDGSGLLDAWVTPASFSIPSGLGFWVRKAADIPTGFTRDTSLDGLIPVGAGTTFSQTFTEELSYGSNWTPGGYSIPNLSVTVSSVTVTGSAIGGPSDNTGGPTGINGLATSGGVNLPTTTHFHSLDGVSLAVSASGTGSGSTATGTTGTATWLPPMRSVVWLRKN